MIILSSFVYSLNKDWTCSCVKFGFWNGSLTLNGDVVTSFELKCKMLKGLTTLIDQIAYSSFLALIPRTTFKNEDLVSSFVVYITSYSSMKRTTFFSHPL